MVLAIDPGAKFVEPDPTDEARQFFGPVAAELGSSQAGFAQHIGRSVYAIHQVAAPDREDKNARVVVSYKSGRVLVAVDDGKGRAGGKTI